MSLISLYFVIFMALLLGAYYLLPKRYQWATLLIASLVYYLSFGIKSIVYLLFTALTTFGAGIFLGRINSSLEAELSTLSKEDKKAAKAFAKTKKRRVLAAVVICNIGLLALVKFAGNFATNYGAFFGQPDLANKAPFTLLVLTIGFSFYVFQTIGYVTDVYRGVSEPCKSFPRYLLFVCFFPQLLQGPISPYEQLYPQLVEPKDFSARNLKFGIQLMLWGYFKKAIVADRLAVMVNSVFDNYTQYGGAVIFLNVMLYCIQLYGDFSGGIDIIRGAAQTLGIEMVENFRRPYFAKSTAEFWRRWHISLCNWMRDYLFYPISRTKLATRFSKACRSKFGNSFGSTVVPAIATFIVFTVVGIWHGAGLNWLVYGVWNGVLISGSMLLASPLKQLRTALKINPDALWFRLFLIGKTFILVTIGRYFSRAPSLSYAWDMLKRTFDHVWPYQLLDGTLLNLGLSLYNIVIMLAGCVVILIVSIVQERGCKVRETLEKQSGGVQFAVNFVIILVLVLFGIYAEGYVAAQFVYANV